MKTYFVYILGSEKNGTIYIGVTNNLAKRIWEHKNSVVKGFTSKYGVNKLVYFEDYSEIQSAIKREKRLKEWPRYCKIKLIEKNNPQWIDLYDKVHY